MDIDLDFPDRDKVLAIIKHIPASRTEHGFYKKHVSGVYCQSIPVNPLTNLASIDYKEAESRGFFKMDFLNVGVYKDVRDTAHLEELMERPPIWELLLQDEFTNLISHINGHGRILRSMRPTTVEQLAAVLALIRPAKTHLIGETWEIVNQHVWGKPSNGDYYFKKSHATAYALLVIVHMNLVCEQYDFTAV